MKSPQGLIWNTPTRRKAFVCDDCDFRALDLELFLDELEAVEALAARHSEPEGVGPRLRLVKASQAEG
ncbi:hypothetical protein JST97_04600 [bacterium]|nr:hypothetical protein [bacterium]